MAEPLSSFGVLAGASVTNTGPSVITGNIGLSPGSAITGFPPGVVNAPYTIYQNDAVAAQAQSDLVNAYNILAGRQSNFDLTGQDLGGKVLTPGVYSFSAASQLTGTLTLDAQNNPNAVFIFNIGSSLTTASASAINLVNGARGGNVFFRVGSSATLGTGTSFAGEIYALASITLNTAANIACGGALAVNGSVTLDTNNITVCMLPAATYASSIGASSTTNQSSVASAIDRYVASGGTLPLSFQTLQTTASQAELAAAATQLSGEAAAGIRPAGVQAMNSFVSAIFDSTFDSAAESGYAAPVSPSQRDIPGRGTVRALGYAPDSSTHRANAAFGSLDKNAAASPSELQRWTLWGAGYGGQSRADGNAATGSHDRVTRASGFAAGADYRVSPELRIGFALGGGGSRFGLSEGLGGGRSDGAQAALYARANFGSAYVMSVVAFAWNDVTTDRTVDIGGASRLTASLRTRDVAGQIEAGYRVGWLAPFASIGVQSFSTPGYSETSNAGPSTFALSYRASTTVGARTQLGFRIDETIASFDNMTIRLRAKVAWAHDFNPDTSVQASFQSLPGANFVVYGAASPSNSLLLSAGPSLTFQNGLTLAASLESQLARDTRAFYGRGQIRYAF